MTGENRTLELVGRIRMTDMLRMPIIGWFGVAILSLAPFMTPGAGLCAMPVPSSPEMLRPADCCCGPGCHCCEVSSPPQTPLPPNSKAPQANHSQETYGPTGGLVVTVLTSVQSDLASENVTPPSERPVYLLTRHFRN